MKSILDKSFRYIPSVDTDIRKTFSRIKKELADKSKQIKNVTPIKKKA